MKSLFKKKSKQYSNISEPVSELDPQRIASLKSRNYSDLDPEVMKKIKQQHYLKNAHMVAAAAGSSSPLTSSPSNTVSTSSSITTAGASTAIVSRTNSCTTHATMPSTDQTEHSSASQNSSKSAQSLDVTTLATTLATATATPSATSTSANNNFPAPPVSHSKSKRKLFLLKKKQATNHKHSTLELSSRKQSSLTSSFHKAKDHHQNNNIHSKTSLWNSSSPPPPTQKNKASNNGATTKTASHDDIPASFAGTTTTSSAAAAAVTTATSAIHTNTSTTGAVPITPNTLATLFKHHRWQYSSKDHDPHEYNEYDNNHYNNNDYNDDDIDDDEDYEVDAITDAPTEFFQPSYLFHDDNDHHSSQKEKECKSDPVTDSYNTEKGEMNHNSLDRHHQAASATKRNLSKHRQRSSNKEQSLDDSPPPPPTKRLPGFGVKRSSAPEPPLSSKEKQSSNKTKGRTKRRQSHEKNLIFHDIGTSSTCSDLDKTFDPEIVSVSSDITSPTFQPLDSSLTGSNGNQSVSPSSSWREKIQLPFKTCSNHDENNMDITTTTRRRSSFWDTVVDGLCSSKPMKSVNDDSIDCEDVIHAE